jgi:uncharacterized protein YbjT (DUF2867 family)
VGLPSPTHPIGPRHRTAPARSIGTVRLLVLGGTWFLGRAVVDAGLRAGHDVTVFNRGRSAGPPAGVRVMHGDRTDRAGLDRLAEAGPWDAVVDVPGVIPAQVRDAARALRSAAGRYVFVSTVSAYRDWPAEPVSEQSPLHDGDPDADPMDWTWGTGIYGRLKAGAEEAVRREFPADLTTILRPGVILGPGEYGGRLTWWLARAARGGQILAPWTEIPMWRIAAGTWAIDTMRAEAAGLACRPLPDTVTDTWTWLRAGGVPVAHGRRALHGLNPRAGSRSVGGVADHRPGGSARG